MVLAAFALLLSAASKTELSKDDDEIVIKEKLPIDGHLHRAPSLNPLVFECCVMHGQEVALLAASRDCEANMEVRNFTTGHTEDYDTVLSTSPLLIPLFGDGQYSITITLTSGQIYEGEFEL